MPQSAALLCMTFKYAHKVVSCSATKEATTSLNEPMRPTLDEALEYVVDDELVEVRVNPFLVSAAHTRPDWGVIRVKRLLRICTLLLPKLWKVACRQAVL